MIYFDYAATTPTDPRVVKKMTPYFSELYGNPSSLYRLGRQAKKAIEDSRAVVASFLNCADDEVFFTFGGTESINMAILGLAKKIGRGKIITSKVEHHAVLHACQELEKRGFEVEYLPVDSDGLIDLTELERTIDEKTFLVSIMYANNEVGSIEPIAKIAKIVKKHRLLRSKNHKNSLPLFLHTDACQATGYLDTDVEKLGVDLLSFNGSKIYGPKGVGVLYKRSNVEIEPIIFGGGQERGLRSGTENVPGIVGLSEAVKLIDKADAKKQSKLRDYFISELLKIEGTNLNGPKKNRLPNNINVSFEAIEGESLMLYLDKAGICCSTGSACTSALLEPSHVITALGHSKERAHGSIRFTIGRKTAKKEIDEALRAIKKSVLFLRKISAIK